MPPNHDLIACHHCDTLHTNAALPEGAKAHCARCGAVLKTQRSTAIITVLALAMTSLLLMIAAVSFPFLDVTVAGKSNSTSVIGAVLVFADTFTLPLALAVGGFIILLPLLRLAAIVYAVFPLASGSPPTRSARRAFGLSETLRPWSMAEIFMVGVAVALVKVAGLATISFGPAFWAFTALVILTFFQDTMICRYSIWRALDTSKA